MKIKRLTIFSKAIIYSLVCGLIALVFIMIISKYAAATGATMGDILADLETTKIFYLAYSSLNNVFGFNAAIGAYVGGWFAIFFVVLIVGAVVILTAYTIFAVAGIMGRVGARY